MSKFTIDGKEINFTQGQTIIEAAKENGIDIPHFCWHPALSVSGNCRICLVEIEKNPKPMIACSTLAAEGMVVYVNSEKAIASREHVMEFLLINHPLDCPICDEAGECKLQDYAYNFSSGESRFNETKVSKNKRVELGPYVMFDQERCIACSRCIRFSNEIVKEEQLTFVKRGDRVTIETFPGKKFDNSYSLNVVDICPVGALTNRDFRFKARVWDMSDTKSICIGCSRGCNIDIWARNNEILRLTPRDNQDVNKYWMCDFGRIESFKHVSAENRIKKPLIKRDGKLTEVSWDEALSRVYSELKLLKGNEFYLLASSKATLEENYLFLKFARNLLKVSNISAIEHEGGSDDLLILSDKTPNKSGLKLLGLVPQNKSIIINEIIENINSKKLKGLILLQEDLVNLEPGIAQILSKLELLIVIDTNLSFTTEYADIVIPLSTFAEKNGLMINYDGRIQRLKPAISNVEEDKTLDNINQSRLDKFGTEFDKWGVNKKIDALPLWKIIMKLSKFFDKKFEYKSSEDIFSEISSSIPVLKNIDYEKIGESGIQIKI